jgi:protein-disulfide isomerase
MHPHAEHAAEIAEAAATHKKFWEMHDMLYTHQDALDDQHLAEYATLLGVPGPEVKRAIAQHAILDRVREDFMSGVRSGVNGTPTFFVNGVRHDGSYDRDNLLAAIAEAGQCWIQVAAIERVPAELGIIVAGARGNDCRFGPRFSAVTR